MWKYIVPRTKLAKATGAHAVLLKLLDDFVNQNETEPIRVLVRTWKDQALVLTYQQIRTWIDSGDVSQADLEAWRGDYMKALGEKLKPIWMKAASAPVVPDNPNFKWISDSEWEYSPQKGGMDRWLRDHTAKLVTKINDQQQQALKDVIAYGKLQKMGADELSKYLRPLVGLNSPQAMANAKYYQTMKAKLAEEHPRMKPENIEKKARHMAQMYGEKQHRDRAKMIAQTELVNVYNSGSHYAIMQAISDGYIDAVTKTWVTARSDRVCAGCAALEGVTIPVDDYFAFRGIRVLYPTAHPRCKCVVEYNINEQKKENYDTSNYYMSKAKIDDYLLKPGAKHSKELFDLGYSKDDSIALNHEINAKFPLVNNVEYVYNKDGSYKFSKFMELGITQSKTFRTVWLQEPGSDKPRFVTAYRFTQKK
ncbi:MULTISPECIES: phage minor head protein [unclassified Bilifractor]|uniref:phage minor head protein n=1 Tax=unclassified Bilifractor TaxID=2815795 RepID=UPI003F91FD80